MDIKRSVSLVLSSGGAKGYAHIGAIKAIEESGLAITSLAGTSMGALVGGLYAAGKLDEANEWLQNIDSWDVFKVSDLKNASFSGLLNGDYIMNKLHEFIGDVKIEDLPIDYCAIATNLDNGKEVVIRKGSLLEAIRMSISMPVLFIPYEKNGRHYVDGGLVNGLPINRVKRHKGDFVIAVDLDTYGNGSEKNIEQEMAASFFSKNDIMNIAKTAMTILFPVEAVMYMGMSFVWKNAIKRILSSKGNKHFLRVLLNSFSIALRQNKIAMKNQMNPEVYLNIELQGKGTFSFASAKEIEQLGYDQMKEKLRRIEFINHSQHA